MERGQEWYVKTARGEELLAVGKKLRGYLTKGSGVAPDKFIGMCFGGQPITVEEYNALTALRMETVSYTHLDVYKRQPKYGSDRRKPARH